jgi:hypothetical protein
VNTPETGQGQLASQSGAGVIAATFGYDTSGTGNLNSLTTSAGTTSWKWDQATGELSSVRFADGTSDSYAYNNKLQLVNIAEPGLTASPNFTYDPAGDLTSWSLTDMLTGPVSSSVKLDSLLRPQYVTDTDNGKTFTETSVYNAQGQLAKSMFGSAANATVQYNYYQTGDSSANASPGSLKALTVNNLPAGQPSVATTFNYDPSSQRIQTISVNGIAIQYGFTPAGQVSSVSIGSSDGNGNLLGSGNVVINYTPDATDGARLSDLKVVNNQTDQTLFDEAVGGYNQEDQRTGETVTRTDITGSGTSTQTDTLAYGYNASEADALASATDTPSSGPSTSYTFGYDGAGNWTNGVANVNGAALGTPNNVNEMSGLTYNTRGDQTNDGVFAYGYDALDRLISITPDQPSADPANPGHTQEKLGYDSQGRVLWEDEYSYGGGQWTLTASYRALWDGNQLVALLDGNNNVLQAYSYGPTSPIAETDFPGDPNYPASLVPQGQQPGPMTFAIITDLSGDTAQVVNPTGGPTIADIHYNPWGLRLSVTGVSPNICLFGGKGEIELPGMPAGIGISPNPSGGGDCRSFNFVTHSFMQHDVAGIVSSAENEYSALGNDPVNNIDPSGELYSQLVEFANNVGRKYIDPYIIKAVQRVAGTSAADTTAQLIAGTRGFDDQLAIGTDFVRTAGNLVDDGLHGFPGIVGAVNGIAARTSQAAAQGNGLALGELTGMNRIAEGIYNVRILGKPQQLGDGWARFNAIGNGTASTLNSVVLITSAPDAAYAVGNSVINRLDALANLSSSGRPVLSATPVLRGTMRRGMLYVPFTGGATRQMMEEDLLSQQGMKEIPAPSNVGMQNPVVREAVENGTINHGLLQEQMRAKGWLVDREDTAMIDPATGTVVYPDAVTPNGRPIEIKPRTDTGVQAGDAQLPKYERATGKRGRVIYYEP